MFRKRIIAVLLMLATVFFFVTCKKAGGKLEMEDGKPVLTMYIHSSTSKPLTDSDLQKLLNEATGYKVKKTFLVADQATTSGIMLASGKYADILNMREDTAKFVQAGVFIPLEDLIIKNAPRIYELYKPYWEQIKNADGHIYTIPEIYPFNPQLGPTAGPGPGIGIYIQKAVLEWAKYPTIKTLPEYFALLKKYKEANPTIDGQPTIGFSFAAEGWRLGYLQFSHSFLSGYPNESGPLIDCIVGGQVDNSPTACTGTWTPRDPFANSTEFHDTLKVYNQAFLDGLLPKETIVQTHEQYNEKISSGRVLGVFDQGWEFDGATKVLRKEKPDRILINIPVTLKDGITLYSGMNTPNYGAGYGISVKARDPVAAIKYLDATLSEKNLKLMMWGVEGTDYTLDSKGVYTRTPEQRQKALDTKYTDQHFGNVGLWVAQGKFSDGNSTDPGAQPGEYFAMLYPAEQAVNAAYHVKSMSELFPAPSDRRLAFSPLWSFSFDPDKDKAYIKVASDRDKIVLEYLAKLIYANAGSYEGIWAEFNKKMAAVPNGDLWLKTWQDRIQDRISKWNARSK